MGRAAGGLGEVDLFGFFAFGRLEESVPPIASSSSSPA